jgi:hypothetical protein
VSVGIKQSSELRLANEVRKVLPTSLCVHFPSPADWILKYLFKDQEKWKCVLIGTRDAMFEDGEGCKTDYKQRLLVLVNVVLKKGLVLFRSGIRFCVSLLSAKMLRAASRWLVTVWMAERQDSSKSEIILFSPQNSWLTDCRPNLAFGGSHFDSRRWDRRAFTFTAVPYWTGPVNTQRLFILFIINNSPHVDRLCGLVIRIPGYRSRGFGFYSRSYQIFWEVVGLKRGTLSLVRIIEELLGWKSSGSGVENRN